MTGQSEIGAAQDGAAIHQMAEDNRHLAQVVKNQIELLDRLRDDLRIALAQRDVLTEDNAALTRTINGTISSTPRCRLCRECGKDADTW